MDSEICVISTLTSHKRFGKYVIRSSSYEAVHPASFEITPRVLFDVVCYSAMNCGLGSVYGIFQE